MSDSRPSVTVKVMRRFDAAPESVFDAFLDPSKASKFLFATPTGQMVRAEIDPRVGGGFVFIDRRPNGDAEHYGTYLEIERPRKLAFKFAVRKDATNADPVTIEIVPRQKRSELTLTHTMAPEFAKYKEKVTEGWTTILAGLAETLLRG